MNVQLNAAEIAELMKQAPETKSDGGWQSLLVRLQENLQRPTGELSLSTQDLEQIPRYAFDYGNGGWEDRLTAVFGRHLGAKLGRQ